MPPEQRVTTPLFGPTVGVEFTHHELESALELMLVHGAGVSEEELHNYSVHSFRIYAACALLAADAPRYIIKRMLRWRGDESLETYARLNNTEWAQWTARMVGARVDSTIASRLTYMDFSDEVRARFTDVAKSLLSMGSRGAARAGGL